jgi:hypothetical protein
MLEVAQVRYKRLEGIGKLRSCEGKGGSGNAEEPPIRLFLVWQITRTHTALPSHPPFSVSSQATP